MGQGERFSKCKGHVAGRVQCDQRLERKPVWLEHKAWGSVLSDKAESKDRALSTQRLTSHSRAFVFFLGKLGSH